MANAVSPSDVKVLTSGQAGKFADLVVAAALKLDLPSDVGQQVLESQGAALADECALLLKKRVEAASNIIVRRVPVNRNRTPQQMLDATGRNQHTEKDVVKAMPKGEGDEAEIHFFTLGRYVRDADLDKEYDLRGLKPADPYSVGAINEADPAFADERPHSTYWKDSDGNWCFAAFGRWDDERDVFVNRCGFDWHDCWWFAGTKK
jgi:hypothetical protein